ncbi:MAG: Kelch repeat-containing protein [Sandaracinaceae bacterium]
MRTRILLLSAIVASACSSNPPAGDDAAVNPDANPIDATPNDATPPDGGASGWRTEPALPVALQEIAAVAYRGQVWVIGGFEGLDVVSTVRIFAPATGTWRTGPPLPAPRHHLAVAVHDGDLYALGGMETLAFAPLDTAWVLRADSDAWQDITPLPLTRGAGAAVTAGDRIVLVGGNEARGGLATQTLVYIPADDRWQLGAAIPSPREHLAAAAVDGAVWAVGGRRNSLSSNRTEVEIYDVDMDRWTDGPALPSARGGFTASRLGRRLIVVGGEEPGSALATVDAYDLDAGVWSALPTLNTARHGHGAVSLDGVLYIVGGGDAPNFAPVDVVESLRLP